MKVKFKQWDCILKKSTYANNGQTSLHLLDETDGSPVATATINIPGMSGLAPNEVVIKDYSENEGMYEALIEAGVIGKAEKSITISDFVKAPICKLKV